MRCSLGFVDAAGAHPPCKVVIWLFGYTCWNELMWDCPSTELSFWMLFVD